jgi:hypothetical protein
MSEDEPTFELIVPWRDGVRPPLADVPADWLTPDQHTALIPFLRDVPADSLTTDQQQVLIGLLDDLIERSRRILALPRRSMPRATRRKIVNVLKWAEQDRQTLLDALAAKTER